MKSVKQQLTEYSALFERALSGDRDAEQEIDAILRKLGSSFVEQAIAHERMNAAINDPVNQFIQNMPYADLRRLVISRLQVAPIETSDRKQGKAGRKSDQYYDQASEMIRKGTPTTEARQWFFERSKIKPDTDAVKAFNAAMRRRRKATE